MKVSEQISLLLSGKVTYDQLKELKEEEKAEKDHEEESEELKEEKAEKDHKEESEELKEEEKAEKDPEDSKLKKALEQVEALTKQVEDLQKKNTQKDIEDKTGNDKFDMTEFVKNFRG